MPKKVWSVAVVGPGWVAGAYLEVFKKRDDVRVTHVVGTSVDHARAFAEAHQLDCAVHDKLDAALADRTLDIVGVYTPHHLHTSLAIAAARAGKHLIVEKPLCLSLPELQAMRAAVKSAGVKSITGFVLRWNPLLQIIQRNVADGTLGEIIFAEVDYLHSIVGKPYTKPWHCVRETAGTSMLIGGCHAIDAMRFIVGKPVVEVTGVATSRTKVLDYPSTEIALLKFADGSVGKVSCCLECVMPYVFNVGVFGTKGTFRNNQFAGTPFTGQTGWASFPTIMPDSSDVNHHPFAGEVDEFISALNENRRPLPDIEDAAETIEIALATAMSAEQGRPIKLPLA